MSRVKSAFFYNGKYQIFSNGVILSYARRGLKELVGKISNCGYRTVLLTVNKKRLHRLVHRMVAEAFIPNPEDKPQVNHKDGNKLNNNAENLEWMTSKENHLHARDAGLYPYAKINMTIANDIRELYQTNKYSHRDLAKKFKIGRSSIAGIITNKRWVK